MTTIREIAPQIAAHMPPGWAATEDANGSNWADLRHAETGASLSLTLNRDGLLHISGNWPQRTKTGPYGEFKPEDTSAFKMNVSTTKSPEKIAREIERRILGAYLAAWGEASARMKATLAGEAECLRAARDIASSVGSTTHQRNASVEEHEVSTFRLFERRRGSATVKVTPSEAGEPAYVSIDLNGITPEEAKIVLAIFKEPGLESTAVRALYEARGS